MLRDLTMLELGVSAVLLATWIAGVCGMFYIGYLAIVALTKNIGG